jgi:hypothetical protein
LEPFDVPIAANVAWGILSASIRSNGGFADSSSQPKANRFPEYIYVPKKRTIPSPSSPRRNAPCELFSNSRGECLEDEFEFGYDQFLKMIDPSLT